MLRLLTDLLVGMFFLGMAGSFVIICITTVEDLAAFRQKKETPVESALLHAGQAETRL